MHVPALAQHHHADDAIDRALLVIDLARGLSRDVQILLRYFAGSVGVNDQQLFAAELGRIFLPQPIAHIVGFGRVVHHHEQHRLLAERRQLLAVFLPPLHARRQIGLIAGAGDIRSLLGDALRDSLERALHDIVDDRLLERIVVDGPGEQLPLAVARRGREIELRGQSAGDVRVQARE